MRMTVPAELYVHPLQSLEAERIERREEVDGLRQCIAEMQAQSTAQAAKAAAELEAAQQVTADITKRADDMQASAGPCIDVNIAVCGAQGGCLCMHLSGHSKHIICFTHSV